MENSALINLLRSNYQKKLYGKEEREPYQSEIEFFKSNKGVAGMASEDNKIVMNPFSELSENELNHVRMNESARLHMREIDPPEFSLTDAQNNFLNSSSYKDANDIDKRSTIAARIISGDPSAGVPTSQQMEYVKLLRQRMGIE